MARWTVGCPYDGCPRRGIVTTASLAVKSLAPRVLLSTSASEAGVAGKDVPGTCRPPPGASPWVSIDAIAANLHRFRAEKLKQAYSVLYPLCAGPPDASSQSRFGLLLTSLPTR